MLLVHYWDQMEELWIQTILDSWQKWSYTDHLGAYQYPEARSRVKKNFAPASDSNVSDVGSNG